VVSATSRGKVTANGVQFASKVDIGGPENPVTAANTRVADENRGSIGDPGTVGSMKERLVNV
jgi:hypothetical protein